MNLIVDIGNSTIKYAVYQKHHCVWHQSADKDSVLELQSILSEFHIGNAIISSVAQPGRQLKELLDSLHCPVIHLSSSTNIPISIGYETPETLGADRLAAVIGAWNSYKGEDVLVIDMGTCITYDVLTKENIYIGGNIAPGLEMRLQAMHEHTAQLPEVHAADIPPGQIGKNTQEAMQSGVFWGIKFEIDGYLLSLKKEMPRLKAILTGGDSEIFTQHTYLKLPHDNMLVEKGLNTILEYNKDNG